MGPNFYPTLMLPRTVRRLETTLLSSRQSLPRPARLYSTPTKRANAPALATASLPYYPSELPLEPRRVPLGDELSSFLKRNTPYTILPTPLPNDSSSELNDYWYSDSVTRDLVAVMDACLHNLYDVPRAKTIFESLRQKSGNPILSTRVYNAFLEAYINMATGREPRRIWLEFAWELYHAMESGTEQFVPNASTYALMLLAYHRSVPAQQRRTTCLNSLQFSSRLPHTCRERQNTHTKRPALSHRRPQNFPPTCRRGPRHVLLGRSCRHHPTSLKKRHAA